MYFDKEKSSCKCDSYRINAAPDCPNVREIRMKEIPKWILGMCGYRLRTEETVLFGWHPMVAKTKILTYGIDISVVGKILLKNHDHMDDCHAHVIRWVRA